MPKTRWFRFTILGIVASACVVLAILASRFRQRPELNVILITLGTTRADRIGCYGCKTAQTPALDDLARSGALFEHAYSSVPLTLPAHATIFTSLYPPEHGLHVDGRKRLPRDVPLLTEFLKARNYDTAAFVPSFALNAKFGLSRGFDVYDDAYRTADADSQTQPKRRDGQSVTDAALAWLQGRRGKPFFCWVHLADAQYPYDARQATFGDAFRERPYEAGIAFADLQVRRLTEFLRNRGLTERTLIVAIGDHGEGLMEHGEAHHGMQLYDSTLRVPLIVAGPHYIVPGTRVAVPVSHVDVLPTILSGVGSGPTKRRHRGMPLIAAMAGKPIEARLFHIENHFPFVENRGEHRGRVLIGIVTQGWKYIQGAVDELYDLNSDPGETTNVADQEIPIAKPDEFFDDDGEEPPTQLKRMRGWARGGKHNMEQRTAPPVDLTSEERRILDEPRPDST